MRRTAARVLVIVGLLASTFATAGAARAAGDVVVSVSPSSVAVGKPVEVLVRTFRVVETIDLSLPFEAPVQPYPVPSGVWNVLYSWADYPFDVVAQHEDGSEVQLALKRDPTDSTLWRGVVSLPTPGTWTVWIRNFQHKEPGSTAVVTAVAGPAASAGATPGATTTTSALGPVSAAIVAAILGLLSGLAIGRRRTGRLPH